MPTPDSRAQLRETFDRLAEEYCSDASERSAFAIIAALVEQVAAEQQGDAVAYVRRVGERLQSGDLTATDLHDALRAYARYRDKIFYLFDGHERHRSASKPS